MQALETVFEHRSIALAKDFGLHLDDVVRSHPKVEVIISRMVDLAERDSIGHHRLAARIPIRYDMGGIQQISVSKATKRTLIAIGRQHPLAESLLVQPDPHGRGDVCPASRGLIGIAEESAARGFGAVVIQSGNSGMSAGLKIPWGPSKGTRLPSKGNPRLSTAYGKTSPWRSCCACSHRKASRRTAVSLSLHSTALRLLHALRPRHHN